MVKTRSLLILSTENSFTLKIFLINCSSDMEHQTLTKNKDMGNFLARFTGTMNAVRKLWFPVTLFRWKNCCRDKKNYWLWWMSGNLICVDEVFLHTSNFKFFFLSQTVIWKSFNETVIRVVKASTLISRQHLNNLQEARAKNHHSQVLPV